MMQQPIDGQDLPTDWPHVHLSGVRGELSSSQFRDEVWSALAFPNRYYFLYPDYRYKSAASQISPSSGIEP